MTTIVLLGACTVILAAASLFIVGVAVGFGIARRRYCPKAERRQIGKRRRNRPPLERGCFPVTKQQALVVEKRRFMRQEYGGLMSLKQLTHELGLKDTRAAKCWALTHKVRGVHMPKQGGQKSVQYDTDHVAQIMMSLAKPADFFSWEGVIPHG